MFTGIIEETGPVESFREGPGSWRLRVGVVDGAGITFDVLAETRRLTNFGGLAPGQRVNLERSLRADGRLGGHFVTGHIDGTGTVEEVERRGSDHFIRVRGPEGCGRLLIHKGSVAVDGISLTVAEVDGDAFAAWVIPHTMEATNLSGRREGEAVNLEFDMLGKYVEKLVRSR